MKRGIATGNNDFFIVPRDRLSSWGSRSVVFVPILPSPRYLKQEVIDADADGWPVIDRQLALIDCDFSEDEITMAL